MLVDRMVRRGSFWSVLVVAALLACAGSALAYPAGFQEETLVSGLTRPTAVDWTPDGRRLIAEQDGVLKVSAPGSTTAQTVLDLRGEVNSGNDRGLLGLAADADFASNGYVYLLYTRELTPGMPDSHGPMASQLRRVKLSADNAVLEQRVILGTDSTAPCPAPDNDVDCIPADGDAHTIGTVRAAPDGSLYVGSGDAAGYGTVDPLAFRSYDERSLAGKIVRIDRDGRGLPGHPFCPANGNLDQVCAKLWAKGFRNPFRFSLSASGELIVGDVGWGTREELDVIPSGGGSYGWPCREGKGTNPYSGMSQCNAGAIGTQIDPYYDYLHPVHPDPTDAAILGGPRYTGSEYPAEYHDAIIFGDYARGLLRRLDTSGPTPTEHAMASDWWLWVDIETAPDNGDLVFVGFGTGQAGRGSVVRLVYSPGNARPKAVASADPTDGPTAPLTVQFDGSDSSDPDGDDLSYNWDFGDGETSNAVSPTHQYAGSGTSAARTYEAVLTVDDGRGKNDSESVTITVGNSRPALPEIDLPDSYAGGDEIELHGSASDAEDGPLPGSALRWNVRMIHSDHSHGFVNDREGADLTFADNASHDADSFYEILLTATDAGGLERTRRVELHPRTTTITLASDPPGARISYYDTTITAPVTRATAVGFETGVDAEERFTAADGQSYLFQSWSDGGARMHPLTLPATPLTLTARYAALAGPPAPGAGNPPKAPQTPKGAGPRLAFDPVRGLGKGRRGLNGRAFDDHGVARVEGALYRTVGRGRCRPWSAERGRLLAARPCARPAWIAARLSGPPKSRRWRIGLGGRLETGRYELRLRARGRTGATTSRVGGKRVLRLNVR